MRRFTGAWPGLMVAMLLLAGTAAFAFLTMGPVTATGPYAPSDDTVVLERLPSPADPRVRKLRDLRDRLADRPDDLELALKVARLHLRLGRALGDPRQVGLAQGVLAAWRDARQPPAALRLMRAAILRAQHDFAGSLAELDALVIAHPGQVQAQLDRANLLEIMGDARAAEQACFHVMRLQPGLIGQTCMASAGSLSGLARASYEALIEAIGMDRSADPAVRAWALTILGEIARRLDEPATAAAHFAAALELTRPDVYLLAAYADLLLDQGRPKAVLALLEPETGSEVLLLRRAIARHRLGDSGALDDIAALQDRFAAVRARGDVPHLREEARFALVLQDDPERALELAGQNWERQRGPADARLLLEAALAAGAPDAAAPALAWIGTTGIEDAALERLVASLGRLSS